MLSILLAMAVLCLLPGTAKAHPISSDGETDRCIAQGTSDTTIEDVLADPSAWHCGESSIDLSAARIFVRFAVPAEQAEGSVFISRRSAMEGLELAVLDADGAMRTRYYAPEDLLGAHMGDQFMVPLPEITDRSRNVVAALDEPTQTITVERARLAPGDPGSEPFEFAMLLGIAAICGMVVMPIFINLVFYRVLRESFVLWHVGMASAILCQILLSSGLYSRLVPLAMPQAYLVMVLTVGATISAGTMFAWSYIEPGKLHPRLRQLLPWGAGLTMAVSILHALFPFVIRPVQGALYFAAYIPHLILVLACIGDAARRGSRAVKFMIVGWSPLLLVCVIRLVSHLTPLMPATDAWELFIVGSMVEVLVTTVGVADRFMTIKRQRDRARAESLAMETVAERDPLTGLLNRRGLQSRYKALREHGFNQFAVLDLDHFKQVNDRFGHGTGDKVLQCVARALTGKAQIRAARFGGEEFVLVMRGAKAAKVAERLRRSITQRIALDLPMLDLRITASMGLVELPPEGIEYIGFDELYCRADQLLYEAKQAGRDRTISETLMLFDRRKKPRGPDGLTAAA